MPRLQDLLGEECQFRRHLLVLIDARARSCGG
jgi:hypothetical protein